MPKQNNCDIDENDCCGERCHDDCHDDCHPECKPNLCDRTEFSWASNHCREVDQALAVQDGLISKLGYAMPFSGSVVGFSYSANKLPCCDAGEKLVIQINGQDVADFFVDITCESPFTDCFTCLNVPFHKCDAINIVSRKIVDPTGQEMEYDSACGILVTLIVTFKCNIRPKPKHPEVAVLELYDAVGNRAIALTPTVQDFDTKRLEIDPLNYMIVNGAMNEVTLKPGVYRVHYKTGVQTSTSSNLFYNSYLEVDTGSGFVAYPGSSVSTHDLSATGGFASLDGQVIIQVKRGDLAVVRVVHYHNLDSYTITTTPDVADLIVERLAIPV